MARKMAEQTSSHPPFNDLVVLVVKVWMLTEFGDNNDYLFYLNLDLRVSYVI